MEPQNGQVYAQKLKESILLNQSLLTIASDTHTKVNDCTLKFQTALQSMIEQSQQMLPLFELLTSKLSDEENQALVRFATDSTASHQQLFEVWKGLKDAEATAGNNLAAAAEKVKTFTI